MFFVSFIKHFHINDSKEIFMMMAFFRSFRSSFYLSLPLFCFYPPASKLNIYTYAGVGGAAVYLQLSKAASHAVEDQCPSVGIYCLSGEPCAAVLEEARDR